MSEPTRGDPAANDEMNDDRMDWSSAPHQFRASHQALRLRLAAVERQLVDQRALRVRVAAWRAGLPCDRAVELTLSTFTGLPEPAAVLAHHEETLASVLAGVLDRNGGDLTALVDR